MQERIIGKFHNDYLLREMIYILHKKISKVLTPISLLNLEIPYWRLCSNSIFSTKPHDIILGTNQLSLESININSINITNNTIILKLYNNKYYSFTLKDYPSDWLAAFVVYLDFVYEPQDALCIALSDRSNNSCSWLQSIDILPYPDGLQSFEGFFQKISKKTGFYPIVPTVEWVVFLSKLGVKTIQLRIKNSLSLKQIYTEIINAVKISINNNINLIINDYWQEAINAGAYGVHLGQEDLKTADIKMIKSSGLKLGISAHNLYEIKIASYFQPSYISIGPIFKTNTKIIQNQSIGIRGLTQYLTMLKKYYPVIAIGGINTTTIVDILSTGINGIAMINTVLSTNKDIFKIKQLQKVFEDFFSK